jgi:integrase
MINVQQTGEVKKARYGGGSITQVPSTKGLAGWMLKWYGPADQDGNRKRLSQVFKGSKTQASTKLRQLIKAVDDGSYVDKSKESVKDFSVRWMDTYVATNCTLRTAIGYQGNIDRYIIPIVGRIAVQNLTSSQIQGIYAGMLERGLSHTTTLHAHRVLKEMLACAVKWGIIPKNPADGATPPKRGKKQMPMWDVGDIQRFLNETRNSDYGQVFEFAISTGMRRSEICGLKWAAIDLVAGRLEVVATLQQIRGHGLVTGTPKTERSRRSIALSLETVGLLQNVQGAQILAKMEAGPLWQENGYVFTHANGSPVLPSTLTENFKNLTRALEMPPLTFHGLRHAFATLGMVAGFNPKVVSEALGHASVTITLDLYSHVLPNMQDELAAAVAKLLKG